MSFFKMISLLLSLKVKMGMDDYLYYKNQRIENEYKCDEWLIKERSRNFYTYHLERGITYCIDQRPYLISASKDINVRVRGRNIDKSKIFKNPFYVNEDISEITCDDCNIKIFNLHSSVYHLIFLNIKSQTISFSFPASNYSFGYDKYPESYNNYYSINGSGHEFLNHENNLNYSDYDREIAIEVTTNNNNQDSSDYTGTDLDRLQMIGKVPYGYGGVYKASDLINEFNSPGSVTQENSEQGIGTDDKSIFWDMPEFYQYKFQRISGFKCKYFYGYYYFSYKDRTFNTTITKDNTICVLDSFLIASDKEFQVKEKHFISNSEMSDTRVYNSPQFVRSDISEITCDNCTVEGIIVDDFDLTYIVANNAEEVVINFTMPAGTRSLCFLNTNSQYYKRNISYGNEEYQKLEDYFQYNLQYFEEKLIRDTPVSFKTIPVEDYQYGYFHLELMKQQLIGRVPKSGHAFTANDLRKEYESPGSVTQENCELGSGQDEYSPAKDMDRKKKIIERFKSIDIQCDDMIYPNTTQVQTIPKGKSYCTENKLIIGTKDNLEVQAYQLKGQISDDTITIDTYNTYSNPLLVNADISQIKCTADKDCKVQLHEPLIDDSDEVYLALSKSDANLIINNTKRNAVLNYLNSRFATILIEELSYSRIDLIRDVKVLAKKFEYNYYFAINITSKVKFVNQDEEWLYPEFIGKVPRGSLALTKKELEEEFTNP